MSNQNPAGQAVTVDWRAVGAALRAARENLRYSYRELSQQCGVSATQLLRLESGEFDYAAEKLFRVCQSLSIPVGDLIEFGTVRRFTLDASSVLEESDVISAIAYGASNGVDEERCNERAVSFVNYYFQFATHALTSAIEDYAMVKDPTLEESGGAFVCDIFSFSNAERAMLLKALLERPYQRLKVLRLLNEESLKNALFSEVQRVYQCEFPRSISRILRPEGKSFPKEPANISKSILDKRPHGSDSSRVTKASSALGTLIVRLAKVTLKRGLQSRLALDLGVTRQAVNNWLTGNAAPDADKTLRLLEWVTAEEAKQRSAGTGATAPAPKTQPKVTSNEKTKLKSGRRKK